MKNLRKTEVIRLFFFYYIGTLGGSIDREQMKNELVFRVPSFIKNTLCESQTFFISETEYLKFSHYNLRYFEELSCWIF